MAAYTSLFNYLAWMATLFWTALCRTLAHQSKIRTAINRLAMVHQRTHLGQSAHHVARSGGRSRDEILVIAIARVCGYLGLLVLWRLIPLGRVFERNPVPQVDATQGRAHGLDVFLDFVMSFGSPTALDDAIVESAWDSWVYLKPTVVRFPPVTWLKRLCASTPPIETANLTIEVAPPACSPRQTSAESEIMPPPVYNDVPEEDQGCDHPAPPPYKEQIVTRPRSLAPGDVILDISRTLVCLSGIAYQSRIVNFSAGECSVTARVLLAFVPPLESSDHSSCVELEVLNGTHGSKQNQQLSTFHAASNSTIWYSDAIRITHAQPIGPLSKEHLRVEYGKQDLTVKMHAPKSKVGKRGKYYVLLDVEKRCSPDLKHLLPFMSFPFHFVGKQKTPVGMSRLWQGSRTKTGVAASRTIREEECTEMVMLADSIGSEGEESSSK